VTAAVEPRWNLRALTGIRGVAAWFVVLFHIRLAAASALGPGVVAVLGKGYLAVDLFFMLSGFVLWLNYADSARRSGLAAAPLFLARRLARIWPLHIVMLGVAAALAAAIWLSGRPVPPNYPWSELPLHVMLVQNWGFTSRLRWNDPAWSISCEFAAYLLFPLLALAVDWRKLSAPALLAALLLPALGLHLLMSLNGAPTLGVDIPHFGLPRAVAEFMMGTVLCALWERWRDAPRLPLVAVAAAISALAAAALAGCSETLLVPPLFAALLLGLALTAQSAANPLGWRWIHYLGEISYATYLAHFLLFVLFKLLFVGDASHVPLSLLGLFLALTLAASILLHHGVERPAQRRLNRLFKSWRLLSPRPAPAPV
jgi:peptidoglycan/LPS O-acetylase OafA/YrhL